MMHILNNMMKFLKLNLFSTTKCHIRTQKNDSIDSKSKPLHSTNIWIDDINNEVNDPHPTILVIKKINIEHYDLQFEFVIQSHSGSNQKSQFLKDENFTKSSYSMMMEEFEYFRLL